jgi:glycosyltransferase involved in cell wall biosynthesis
MSADGTPLRIALVANTSWYLHNFRLTLLAILRGAGHKVFAIAPGDGHGERLTDAGFVHLPIPLDAASVNPVRELRAIAALRRLFRANKFDLVFSFTPKGNIYSALALDRRVTGFVPNISGLGRGYAPGSPLQALMRPLYRRAFAKADTVLFQNGDDLKFMTDCGLIVPQKARRIPGSGVDLKKFTSCAPTGNDAGAPVFLFFARLLWAKGIGQLVEAARHIRERCPAARFHVLGSLVAGAGGVPKTELYNWVREGIIVYGGDADDVRPHIAAADCVVLPSYYREGVPRSLLEAAAMARPIITTDMAGCRDAIDDGVTGFLCRPRDSDDLCAAMEKFLVLSADQRAAMGRAGRTKMEQQFDETLILNDYLELVARHARRRI